MDWEELRRREFGFLEDIAFFEIGSVCLPPVSVQNAYTEFVREYVAQHGEDTRERSYAMINANRAQAAQLINCEPSEIGYACNTTYGLTVLQVGMDWKPGDNVIISDLENYANLYQWKHLERKGVELRMIRSHDGAYTVEDVEKLIDEHTRLVCITSIGFESGFNADVAEIGEMCHRHGVIYAVDIMQSIGRLPIDVQAMHMDFAATGSHKGLLCTYGSGFFYCSPELQDRLTPYTASKESMNAKPSAWEMYQMDPLPWHTDARRFEAGNFNFDGIYAMSKALKLLLDVGMDNIEGRVRYLERTMRAGGEDLKHIHFGLGELPEKNWSGILIAHYPTGKVDEIKEIVARHKVYGTVKDSYLRLTVDFYNNDKDINTALDALHEMDGLF